MPLQVRENYQNPLTMQKPRPNLGAPGPTMPQNGGGDELNSLRRKRQGLQDEMLLLKGTSAGGEVDPQTQKALEEKLRAVSKDIKSLAAEPKPRRDVYEPGDSLRAFGGKK